MGTVLSVNHISIVLTNATDLHYIVDKEADIAECGKITRALVDLTMPEAWQTNSERKLDPNIRVTDRMHRLWDLSRIANFFVGFFEGNELHEKSVYPCALTDHLTAYPEWQKFPKHNPFASYAGRLQEILHCKEVADLEKRLKRKDFNEKENIKFFQLLDTICFDLLNECHFAVIEPMLFKGIASDVNENGVTQ